MPPVTYLLDTNAISDLMRAESRTVDWLSTLSETEKIITCPIVRGEILFGIGRLPHGQRRSELEEKARQLFDALPCQAIPERAGDFYTSVKLSRQRMGLTLDENDLWIAATTLALGATLVTRDRDFAEVEGLPVITPS